MSDTITATAPAVDTEAAQLQQCSAWMRSVYLDYAEGIPEIAGMDPDELSDPGQCICFFKNMGRLPESGKELDDYTNGEGAFANGIPQPNVQPAVSEEAADTEYNLTKRHIAKMHASAAERNYEASALHYHAVAVFLSANPNRKTQVRRDHVIADLGKLAMEAMADDDDQLPPTGQDADKWFLKRKARYNEDAAKHVRYGASMSLLFGATVKDPILCTDGHCHDRVVRGTKAVSWRRVSILFPLVSRVVDDYCEKWTLLKHVEHDVVALVHDFNTVNLPEATLLQRVRELAATSARIRWEKDGDQYAKAEYEKWVAKLEKSATPTTTVQTTAVPATTPASPTAAGQPTATPAPAVTVSAAPATPDQAKALDKETQDDVVDLDATAEQAFDFITEVDAEHVPQVVLRVMELLKDSDDLDADFRADCVKFILARAARRK